MKITLAKTLARSFYMPARDDFCCLPITFTNSLDPVRPNKTSGLIRKTETKLLYGGLIYGKLGKVSKI